MLAFEYQIAFDRIEKIDLVEPAVSMVWKPPPIGELALSVDVAIFELFSCMGVGAVI